MCYDIIALVNVLLLQRLSGQELGLIASINKNKVGIYCRSQL